MKSQGYTYTGISIALFVLGIIIGIGVPKLVEMIYTAKKEHLHEVAGALEDNINNIHSYWKKNKQPTIINLKGMKLHMSQDGWPVYVNENLSSNRCADIWNIIFGHMDDFITNTKHEHLCQFTNSRDWIIEYSSQNGTVKVIENETTNS